MRRFLPLLVAAVVSLHVASAFAQTEEIQARPVGDQSAAATKAEAKAGEKALNQGWNADWALLFSFNNIFENTSFLSQPITGSIGGTYILSDLAAVRAGVTFFRQHGPVQVTKNIQTLGDTETTTYTVVPPTYTQQYGLTVNADYLLRLTRSAIAPYAGAGVGVGWGLNRLAYVDDKSVVDQRTEIDNNNSSVNLRARGILGAEWRIHESFAFFAEYNVAVTLYQKNRTRNRITEENTSGGLTTTTQTENQSDTNAWFNVSTGLAQGASLGLEVLF